jgi:hypothetical protein
MVSTAQNRHMNVDQRQRRRESFTSIHDDQIEAVALKPALMEMTQELFPGRSRLVRDLAKIDHFFFSVRFNPQGHQHATLLSTCSRLTPHDDAIQDEDFILIGEGI